mgnify:CR=1 FL=1
MTIENKVQHLCTNGCNKVTEMNVKGPFFSQTNNYPELGTKVDYEYECIGCGEVIHSTVFYRQE